MRRIDNYQGIGYNKRMEKYQHSKDFQIKYCEADFRDELKTSVALSYMQEVACSSADELGFGYAYVKPRGYAFMVSAICLECIAPIRLGEVVKVKTWPTPPTHVIFGREYQFLGEDGTPKINASSRWCMLDINSRKLLQSKVLDNQDYSTYNTERVLENVQWKIPVFPCEEGELRYQMTVANSEYDHNMHVNNTRYVDYCLNCFSIAELSQKRVARFQITYVHQCYEGDTLRFYRKCENDGVYLVQGVNAENQIVVQAKIQFCEIGENA